MYRNSLVWILWQVISLLRSAWYFAISAPSRFTKAVVTVGQRTSWARAYDQESIPRDRLDLAARRRLDRCYTRNVGLPPRVGPPFGPVRISRAESWHTPHFSSETCQPSSANLKGSIEGIESISIAQSLLEGTLIVRSNIISIYSCIFSDCYGWQAWTCWREYLCSMLS